MSAPSPLADPRAFLRSLYDAAVARALPAQNTAAFLPPPPRGRTLVLGAGKAGGAMAAAADALWPREAPALHARQVLAHAVHLVDARAAAVKQFRHRLLVLE